MEAKQSVINVAAADSHSENYCTYYLTFRW